MVKVPRKHYPDLDQSAQSVLMTVENLIAIAMGPPDPDKHIINFNMLENVLIAIAKHLRILHRNVELGEEIVSKTYRRRLSKDDYSDKENAKNNMNNYKEEKLIVQDIDERVSKRDKRVTLSEKEFDKRFYENGGLGSVDAKDKENIKLEKNISEKGTNKRFYENGGLDSDNANDKENIKIDKNISGKDTNEKIYENTGSDSDNANDKESIKIDKNISEKDTNNSTDVKVPGKDRSLKAEKSLDGGMNGSSKFEDKSNKQQDNKSGIYSTPLIVMPPITNVTRVGSIEVVPLSQLEELKSRVNQLQQVKIPLSIPTIPSDVKMKQAILKERVSVQEAMDALQLKNRIAATEQMISDMSHVLTSLAMKKALPTALTDLIQETMSLNLSYVSEGFSNSDQNLESDESFTISSQQMYGSLPTLLEDIIGWKTSKLTEPFITDVGQQTDPMAHTTQIVLSEQIDILKETIKSKIHIRHLESKTILEKLCLKLLSKIVKMDGLFERFNILDYKVNDYVDNLGLFEDVIRGLTQNCKENIDRVNAKLARYRADLEARFVNYQSSAVKDILLRMENITRDLDDLKKSQDTEVQKHSVVAAGILRSTELINVMQEEKLDSDELNDALKDKVGQDFLCGMLTMDAYNNEKEHLDDEIKHILNKFDKQNMIWQNVLSDLSAAVNIKGSFEDLLHIKDEYFMKIKQLKEKTHCLALVVGEPTAAILSRALDKDALTCEDSTRVELEVNKSDATSYSEDGPCMQMKFIKSSGGLDDVHYCKRRAGGSHTVFTDAIIRRKAADRL